MSLLVGDSSMYEFAPWEIKGRLHTRKSWTQKMILLEKVAPTFMEIWSAYVSLFEVIPAVTTADACFVSLFWWVVQSLTVVSLLLIPFRRGSRATLIWAMHLLKPFSHSVKCLVCRKGKAKSFGGICDKFLTILWLGYMYKKNISPSTCDLFATIWFVPRSMSHFFPSQTIMPHRK